VTRPEASRRSAGSRAAEGYSDTLELANLDVTTKTTAHNPITLGDPVPWFTAPLIAGGSFILHVHAGRWIVLCFFGSPNNPRVNEELAELLQEASLFDEDRLIVRAVFTTPPDDVAKYPEVGTKALSFLADYDGAITRSFGALDRPRTIVLDPMLRVVADIPWDFAQGHAATVRGILRGLPAIDDSAGVPMHAPALIVPRVLNFELCEFLVRLYEQQGGEDSGFLVDLGSKTKTVVDYRLKRRSDLAVVVPELRELIGGQIVRRLLPAVERYFQFQATRMDRYIVACYDSEIGGHFYRHRDNVNAAAQHRRFAITINLNSDYDGCDLVFPEFGRKTYRAPYGGALVFSCGALHQVAPITRGRRYAFLAFLYSEADAARREANNTRLHDGETLYTGAGDRLIPETTASNDQ
jgi:predicted 2-oxoglutarate/Fe(II)-dependent dioxygenase YbiX/peroxiredoxin